MADNQPIQCTYQLNNQLVSTLTCPGYGSAAAYSGHDKGRNNPQMSAISDIGPIPPGIYYIIDRRSGGRLSWFHDLYDAYGWGTTDRTQWFGLYNEKTGDDTFVGGIRRGNFRLHPEGPMRLSDGCITVVDPKSFQLLANAIRQHGAMTPIPGGGMAYGRVEVK